MSYDLAVHLYEMQDALASHLKYLNGRRYRTEQDEELLSKLPAMIEHMEQARLTIKYPNGGTVA